MTSLAFSTFVISLCLHRGVGQLWPFIFFAVSLKPLKYSEGESNKKPGITAFPHTLNLRDVSTIFKHFTIFHKQQRSRNDIPGSLLFMEEIKTSSIILFNIPGNLYTIGHLNSVGFGEGLTTNRGIHGFTISHIHYCPGLNTNFPIFHF